MFEQTDAGFVGVYQERPDRAPSNQPFLGVDCFTPFAGVPVYQTQWVQSENVQNWLEFGTGYQCQGNYRYRYWGYGREGSWHPLGTEEFSTLGFHQIRIGRTPDTVTYVFRMDGSLKGSLPWSRTFGDVAVGLESYADGAVVNKYADSDLQYKKLASTSWFPWNGRDGKVVHAQMCGAWLSDTSWQAGQNDC